VVALYGCSSVEEGECQLNEELREFVVLLLIGGFGMIESADSWSVGQMGSGLRGFPGS
jgi:hypothetical protein